jgi:kanamycin kinase/aminoglycoside 3'-phosphotransferase-3
MVLKVEAVSKSSQNEHQVMSWLSNYLLVPKVIASMERDDISYLLMSNMKGKMSCSEEFLKDPKELVRNLAKGLRNLWTVPIDQCPFNMSLSVKLSLAKERTDNDNINIEHFEEGTIGMNGFSSIGELYNYLVQNVPKDDLVLAHGDYCLPNIFLTESNEVGYIDLGSCGIADRYQDIALCVRSLKHNLSCVGIVEEFEFYRKLLFDELGIEPDESKIRYYILLDELF